MQPCVPEWRTGVEWRRAVVTPPLASELADVLDCSKQSVLLAADAGREEQRVRVASSAAVAKTKAPQTFDLNWLVGLTLELPAEHA